MELRDASGTLLGMNNPGGGTGAQIQTNLVAGTYYLYIRNSGVGDPLGSAPSGYTSYASLGQYFITGFIAPANGAPLPVQLTTTVNHGTWGSVSPASGSYAPGTVVQLTATPATYYRFVSWTNAASGANNPLSLRVESNVTVGAVFAELFTTNHPTPYWWLASYGFTSNFENAANATGANGIPRWQSYLAGLNPNQATSQPRVSVSRSTGGSAPVLSWNTVTGRLYTIWWGTNVTGTFARLAGASNLVAGVTRFTNTAALALPRTFYRLEIVKP